MNLSPVLARLQTVPLLDRGADLAADPGIAIGLEMAAPYAWLTNVRGQSAPNTVAAGGLPAGNMAFIRQRHEQRFSVLSLVYNAADMRGEAALAEMGTLRGQINAALLGFVPATGYEPIEHVRDIQASEFDGGKLYWLDEYRFFHFIKSNPT